MVKALARHRCALTSSPDSDSYWWAPVLEGCCIIMLKVTGEKDTKSVLTVLSKSNNSTRRPLLPYAGIVLSKFIKKWVKKHEKEAHLKFGCEALFVTSSGLEQ